MGDLWLIGMMGAGKTTVGNLIAKDQGRPFLDVDQLVEGRAGKSVRAIFREDGDRAFRQMESAEIERLAGEPTGTGVGRVIATGGGSILDPWSVRLMRKAGAVVWLDAPPESLVARVGDRRPLLEGFDVADRLAGILEERRPLYERAAHFKVDADRSAGAVAADAGRHVRIPVGRSSEVLIGPDLPSSLLPPSIHREQVAVVAQPGAAATPARVVDRLAAEAVPTLIEVPDRDAAKSLDTVGMLYRQLAELNLGRNDTIVGVGGGATTDLAGFAAATWLRGVESVLIPTTLLGAVDAAIGGKTGINVMGKNLVGAFWHPSRVIVSLDVLAALPEELLREGAAEAVKAGFIADPRIVELFMTHGLSFPPAELVSRAIAAKAAVVSEDFREAGRRAILNFGHTIGHGVEVACGLPHGYAVAVGMVAAAAVSAARYGFDPELVLAPLRRLGLPTSAETADRSTVWRLVYRDKKRTKAGLRMVLLREMADPVVVPVEDEEVDLGLAAIGVR